MIWNWQSKWWKTYRVSLIDRLFLEGKRNWKGISGKETKLACRTPTFPPRLKNKLEGTGWRSGERNRGRGLSALGFGIFALLLPFKSSLPFDRLRIEKWRSLVALSARLKTFSANHIGISSFDISISDFYIRNFLQEYSSTKIYLRREIFVSGKNWKIVFPFFFFLWQPF